MVRSLRSVTTRNVLVLAAIVASLSGSRSTEANSAAGLPPSVTKITVEPSAVQLIGPRSQARLLVTAYLSNGATQDVTDKAARLLVQPSLARFEADGRLRPLKDGATAVQFTYEGKKATAKLTVKDAASRALVSFNNEVVPILTRYGCNQGACHGAQYGKGGLKLSLAGFDPDIDYFALVKQSRGRRIAIADPARSLLLLKPSMGVPHGGGRRLEPNTPDYNTLSCWMKDGAPGPNASDPQVTRIETFPAERILHKDGSPQRIIVRARFSDGTLRDVTPHARLNTLNDAVASCTPDGIATPNGRGQTAIMARYGGQAAVATLLVPFNDLPSTPPGKGSQLASHSPLPAKERGVGGGSLLDALVAKKQRQLGLQPSPPCDDRTFLRRAFLDVLGTPPAPEEVTAFLADKSATKRAKLIDALLTRPEYADYWTLKWGDLLRSNQGRLGPKGMWSFTNWIRSQLRENRPVDTFVHELILAQGSTFTNGPSNYYRVADNPQELAETTSQVFLGVRMQCAKCHHHPFEKWSQADYYQFAAFFARVGTKGSNEFGLFGNERIVRVNDGGEVYHPKTGKVMRPTPLGAQLASLSNGKTPDPDADGDRRRALADWLVGKNNRLFARNIANRYWGYLLGKGIVNPIDDQRVTNPPTNDALLNYLADELIQSGFDLKHLLRVICNSQTYQRSAEATPQNKNDELFFTHYLPRRLPAETLLDAIDYACGTREKFSGLPLGTRAIQLPDPSVNSDFLDTFGRPPRLIACECERMPEPNLSQTLRLLNGELINRKVAQGDGRVAKLIGAKKSDTAILNELYMATLGRPPRARERLQVLGILAFSPDRKPVFEDVLLTLLNSKEFLFNH